MIHHHVNDPSVDPFFTNLSGESPTIYFCSKYLYTHPVVRCSFVQL